MKDSPNDKYIMGHDPYKALNRFQRFLKWTGWFYRGRGSMSSWDGGGSCWMKSDEKGHTASWGTHLDNTRTERRKNIKIEFPDNLLKKNTEP